MAATIRWGIPLGWPLPHATLAPIAWLRCVGDFVVGGVLPRLPIHWTTHRWLRLLGNSRPERMLKFHLRLVALVTTIRSTSWEIVPGVESSKEATLLIWRRGEILNSTGYRVYCTHMCVCNSYVQTYTRMYILTWWIMDNLYCKYAHSSI